MNIRLAAAAMAATAASLGLAATAGATGPREEVVTTVCEGGAIVLVVRGEPVTVLPGSCTDGDGGFRNAWPKKIDY